MKLKLIKVAKTKLKRLCIFLTLPLAHFLRNQLTFALTPSIKEIRKASLLDQIWISSLQDSTDYFYTHMSSAVLFRTREDMWNIAFQLKHISGLYLEFGVHNGKSIRQLKLLLDKKFLSTGEDIVFHGFDSFHGLQENWAGSVGALTGAFSLDGQLPRVPKSVRLYKGFFEQTLPTFLLEQTEPVVLIHLDADTYTSTRYVLQKLAARIQMGTIIIFDEYIGYPGWRSGEFLAWQELVKDLEIRYTYLGLSERGSTTIRVDQVGLPITVHL